MRTDQQGCSTCPIATERWEAFAFETSGAMLVQYDYRHTNGRLFSTIASSVEVARKYRDRWLLDMEADYERSIEHAFKPESEA